MERESYTRVLVEVLSQRLPGTTVVGEASVVAAPSPDATVEVEIQRLDAANANAVTLAAQFALSFAKGRPVARSARFTVAQTRPARRASSPLPASPWAGSPTPSRRRCAGEEA